MAKLTDEDNKKIENAKKKWADANAKGDTEGMASAHAEAESVRAQYGYSGGDDGSQNIEKNNGSWIGSGPKSSSSTSSNSSRTSRETSTDYGSYKDDLDKLTEARRQAQINALKEARQKALDNLDAQEQEIKPYYQNQRNLASSTSQQSARSFAEYLANRGLTNSGASAQSEINRQSALQNTLGNIGTAEANAFRDIANQRTQVENDYVAGLANANSAIDEEYYNNLLNYNEQQRQMIQALQQQSLGQYSNDYQSRINELLSQGYNPNSLEILQLQAARGNKMNNAYSNAFTYSNALQSILAGNINYNTALAAGMTIEEAQRYYNDYITQQRAQAEAEARQQALENSWKQQESDATVRNKNASTANYYDQINKRGTSSNTNNQTYNIKEVISMLGSVSTSQDAKNLVDSLYNNYQIDDTTLETIYAMQGWNL